jgi:hypothetical protein
MLAPDRSREAVSGEHAVVAAHRPVPPLEPDPSRAQRLHEVVAVLAGIVSLLLGLLGVAALATAIVAAWSLYDDPGGIAPYVEHFARALPSAGGLESLQGLDRLVAWVFVVLMLLLLGKLGTWAVAAAGALLRSPPKRGGS